MLPIFYYIFVTLKKPLNLNDSKCIFVLLPIHEQTTNFCCIHATFGFCLVTELWRKGFWQTQKNMLNMFFTLANRMTQDFRVFGGMFYKSSVIGKKNAITLMF